MFDDLITELDSFEQLVSSGKLPRRSILTEQLTTIKNMIVVKLNAGGKLPNGSKSLLSKISRLSDDLITGLRSPEVMSGKDFLVAVRDKFGPLNAALTGLGQGGTLNADQKAQMRTLENDEDKTAAIEALYKNWMPGPTKLNGVQRDGQAIFDDVGYFLHTNFSLDQLKSFDMDAWRQLTYKDIYERTPETTTKMKQELIRKGETDYKALSESYKDVAKRLPTRIQQGAFSAIRFPVVTVWSEVAASKNEFIMRNAGFKVTRVGSHFSVLENQYLLCIDLDKAGVGDAIVLSKDKQRTRTKQTNSALWTAAQNIVNTINDRSPVKYAIASHTVVRNPRNARIALVWLITEKQRLALTQTLHSREVDWDIPRHGDHTPNVSGTK